MAARKEYDEATKAAVMASLLAGQSIAEVADEYHINPSTIKSWKSRQLNGESVATVATEKKEQIGDLLFDYLLVVLKSLKIQAEHFGDKNWLNRQSADALAVLHGVSVDKAVRLLEALTVYDRPLLLSDGGDEEMQG
jgi:transposase-like protein